MTKNVDYYMALKYKITAIPTDDDGDRGFLLEMPELGRLSTCAWGETFDEAYAMLREIQRDNIQDLLSKGLDVPLPIDDENYSHGRGHRFETCVAHQEYQRLRGFRPEPVFFPLKRH